MPNTIQLRQPVQASFGRDGFSPSRRSQAHLVGELMGGEMKGLGEQWTN